MKNYVKEYKGHKVPEGATHVSDFPTDESIEFFRVFNGRLQFVLAVEADWRFAPFNEMNKYAIELPEESNREWVDGLPPAGTICEVSNLGNVFEEAKILFMGEELCVVNHPHFRALEQHYHVKSVEFRPLKSQEQKDREAFIEWAKAGLHLSIDDMGAAFKVVDQLANNGARLPEGE
jgi:hypothetical protein